MIAVWLRQDLRLLDNPALFHACERAKQLGKSVSVVYIATPEQWRLHHKAPIQVDFIYRRLVWLQAELASRGIPLEIWEVSDYGEAASGLADWVADKSIREIYLNKQYEVDEMQRDQQLAHLIPEVVIRAYDDRVLVPPGQVLNKSGEMYKVFTPFRNAWLQQLMSIWSEPLPVPDQMGDPIPFSRPTTFDYPQRSSDAWPVEDESLLERLHDFCQNGLEDYETRRNRPDLKGTSGLSPWLAIGALSPKICVQIVRQYFPMDVFQKGTGAFAWLNELAWRDFYQHLIAAYPRLVKGEAFQEYTDGLCWSRDEHLFSQWAEGKTGYPLVDAAMRQLNATGWMHNRLRMVVASFIAKDLLLDWRLGETYFMEQLIDGDFAANNGGWQWSASTGTDAQPYFRVFNPTSQGENFDPNGDYVRQWVPELSSVPGMHIHQPHCWAQMNGRIINYPKPIVDHKVARNQAIYWFEQLKYESTEKAQIAFSLDDSLGT